MAEYETEEQQVEAIKEWWRENGKAVIGGAFLGIGALVGWYLWGDYQKKLAVEASDIFTVMQEAVIKNDTAVLQQQAKILRDNYASTPYAPLAVLHEAKIQNEKGDLVAAEESLRWVLNNSKQDTVQDIARIRLARLLLANDKVDEAQSMINVDMSDAYASLLNEIRGDIFVAKGEIEQARNAYDQAMQTSGGSGVEFLELKRNDLGSSFGTKNDT